MASGMAGINQAIRKNRSYGHGRDILIKAVVIMTSTRRDAWRRGRRWADGMAVAGGGKMATVVSRQGVNRNRKGITGRRRKDIRWSGETTRHRRRWRQGMARHRQAAMAEHISWHKQTSNWVSGRMRQAAWRNKQQNSMKISKMKTAMVKM